jgi:predicted ATP-grasp superfamily ATP-dependent carboligase
MDKGERPTVFVMEAQAKAALPVIESLARGGLRVAAGSEKRFTSGFYSRACRERHLYPSPRFAADDFKQWMIRLVRRRRIEMVFPVGHYGAVAISEIQDELRRHTRLILPDAATFQAAYAKISTMKTALRAGVPIPDSWFPADEPGGLEDSLAKIAAWPVLIKPSIGVGARGITWCHRPEEVRERYGRIEARHGECYLQDFVPPGGMQYKVDMLVDAGQRVLAGIVYGKTRMYPPDGGSSVLNFSADRPDILRLSARMLEALKWVGFCDFDFVVDPRDHVPKLMEINPRFPESFNMGPSVGLDFPMMMYRMARGEAVEPVTHYPVNRFLRFLPGDLLWFLRVDRRQRKNTWPGWFRFFDRETAYQLIRAHDPGPFMGYLLENAASMMDAGIRRERLRLDSGPARSKGGPAG